MLFDDSAVLHFLLIFTSSQWKSFSCHGDVNNASVALAVHLQLVFKVTSVAAGASDLFSGMLALSDPEQVAGC